MVQVCVLVLQKLASAASSLPPQAKAHSPAGLPAEAADDLCPNTVWGKHWKGIERHLSVLWLAEGLIDSWPAGLEQNFSRLQYLALVFQACDALNLLDLAVLRTVPHVKLGLACQAAFSLSAGTWQSLEIFSVEDPFHIAFSDVDMFVRGTTNFLFSRARSDQQTKSMFWSIQSACLRNVVKCYEYNGQDLYDADATDRFNYITLSSNKVVARHYITPVFQERDGSPTCTGVSFSKIGLVLEQLSGAATLLQTRTSSADLCNMQQHHQL